MENFYSEISEMANFYQNAESGLEGLSNEELVEIINGDSSLYDIERAQTALISKNVKFCIKVVGRVLQHMWPTRDVGGTDLLQEAISKMLDCVKSFDPKKGMFTTYMEPHIKRHVESVILTGGYVTVSDGTARTIRKAMAIYNKHRKAGISNEEELCKLVADEINCKKISTVKKYIMMGRTAIMSPDAFVIKYNDRDDTYYVDGEAMVASNNDVEDYVIALDSISEALAA